jgi:lysozyme family protein
MKENFNKSLKFVLDHECVFEKGHYGDMAHVITENVPGDSGGLTKFGIDQASHPHINIRALDYSQAAQIYRDGEWTRCRCDELPAGYDLAVFDIAVNMGTGTAAKMLQQALNEGTDEPKIEVDGFIGPKTISTALRAAADPRNNAMAEFLKLRQSRYFAIVHNHPSQKKFLNGWLDRCHDLARAIASNGGTPA